MSTNDTAPVTVNAPAPQKGHYIPYEDVGLPVHLGTGKHGSYPGETAYWRGNVDASDALGRLNDIPDTPATRLRAPGDISL